MPLEAFKSDDATVYVLYSDKETSTGLLKLNPKTEFQKHNRPVPEQLTQIQGSCVIKLIEGNRIVKEITMKEGDTIKIPANQFHIHANPFNQVSITAWIFDGDITEVIQGIREDYEKVL